MLIVTAACGGKVADDFTHIDVVNSSSSSSSASSSGGGASSSSGGTSSSCSVPPPGHCEYMLNPFEAPASAALVTDASCKTTLYLAQGSQFGFDYGIRRYNLLAPSGVGTCVFELAPSDWYHRLDGPVLLAANTLGHLYGAGPGSLFRFGERESKKCRGANNVIPATPGAIAMAPDSSVAYAVYDSAAPATGLRAFVIRPEGEENCVFEGFALEGGSSLAKQRGIAVDAQGRLHIASGGAAPRVTIYGPSGKLVQDYGPFENVRSITACKAGLCIDEVGSVKLLSDDGTFRADLRYTPSAPLGEPILLVGAPRGPLFLLGQSQGVGTSIDVLAVP